ncbi:hypothetical protein SASPL_147778 [Salvia splendens]|uniref:RING-type domain-containing protein n=1 Tax=Salvia splendens TaxID=180675 RepID=A0A8X8WF31_SALSN|nr:hypothetical protein SASPL_147778 [Salvia splendens]
MLSSAAHPPQHLSSDSDSDSSSPSHSHQRHPDLSSSIFQSYLSHSSSRTTTTAADDLHHQDLIKIQSFLTSSRAGGLSCLICLERIKPTDPTWSCSSRCFAIFHLLCIQSWAHQSTTLAASRASARAAVAPDESSLAWPCPKCRVEYLKPQTPKNYYCFCGKVEDPPRDPWVLPHSCGEICGRSLKYDCGHFCLLLCHPGPCPACPKLVKNRCFCGKLEDVRRCGLKEFSCKGVCGKGLECGAHRCGEICHDGSCQPCRVKGSFRCQCGKEEMVRECCEREFRCNGECKKMLSCGRHVCEKGCHEGGCGECPFQGKRSCPCGKRVYEGMACDVSLPLCGSTCNKLLSCGFHRCPERCHHGPCVENCRMIVTKPCRCGSFKKQVHFVLEGFFLIKCGVSVFSVSLGIVVGMLVSAAAAMGTALLAQRYVTGSSGVEITSAQLHVIGNSVAIVLCNVWTRGSFVEPYRGACAPCPLMVRISCACGNTHFEVPCGTETEQKPPKCHKPCPVAPLCRHAPQSKPHRCHYGACPPCRLTCGERYSCGHECQLRCHGPVPPPRPEFTLKPKKKKGNYLSEATPGSPCPPCPEVVLRSCFGRHIGAERMDRDPKCPHPCPMRCHPGECPPCKTLIKRSCHCGSMVHVFECKYYNCLSQKEQMVVRSCKGPCHRKLPNCTHLCPETCHPGPCPSPDKCSKKVTVRCGCQTLKKEWLCKDVQAAHISSGCDPKEIPKNQFGVGLLPCGSDCKSKVKALDSELHLRQVKPQEEKESDKASNVSKRRRRRQRVHEEENASRLQRIVGVARRILLVLIVVAAVVVSAYFGYKGLLWLSDWMNQLENRQTRRYPRV